MNDLFPLEYRSPKDLIAHDLNWGVHSDKQAAALSSSIGEFGWLKPVIVNGRTGRIIDGHARVAYAKNAGVTQVPCRVVDVDEAVEARMLATIDRVGELRGRDDTALWTLLKTCLADDALPPAGFDEADIAALLASNETGKPPKGAGAPNFGDDDDDFEDPFADDDGPGSLPRVESHVRMVQLFLDGTTQPEFLALAEELQKAFDVETVTDAVLEAVRYAHHQVVTCKK